MLKLSNKIIDRIYPLAAPNVRVEDGSGECTSHLRFTLYDHTDTSDELTTFASRKITNLRRAGN